MKKILTLALAIGCGVALGQKADNVGIGTTKPDPSALLELNSNSKGFLLPRMTETQRDAIKNPSMGLVIFQTDKAAGTYTFDGTAWQPSNARVGATSSVGAWDKQGNAIDGTDFLGTTNFVPLVLKAGGNTVAVFRPELSASLFLGRGAGAVNSGVYNVGVGVASLGNNTTGTYNMGVGTSALETNISGGNNSAIGVAAGFYITGSDNVAIGTSAAAGVGNGSGNVAIGSESMKGTNVYTSQNRSYNTAIGYQSLRDNLTGNGNVAIGYQSAFNETGSNKLYISNSNTTTPLIGGDFTNNYVKFHTGTSVPTATAGFVAIGDFTAAGSTTTPGVGAINSFPAFTAGSQYRLIVQDGILTEKLKVALRNGAEWADYVFEPDYKLMPLEEVEKFSKQNKHLPNVPSADDMVKDGIDFAKTSQMFMEKIEELTIHIIELNKRIKTLEEKRK